MALKDINIMSVFLSYSAFAPLTLSVPGVTPSGSKANVSSLLRKAVVDNISSLITKPTSPKPTPSNTFCASFANLFTLPSSTASAKLIIFGATSSGGKNLSCLTCSASCSCVIVSSGNTPSDLSLAPNSSGVSLNPSALLAISNSKLSRI